MPVTANFAGPVQTDATNRFRMLQSMARSHASGAQSIPNATDTVMVLDANDINTDGMWSGGANTKFTAAIGGKYIAIGGASFVSNATGVRYISVRKNGATYLAVVRVSAVSGDITSIVTSDLVQLAAGDYIEFTVYQTSGGALNLTGAATCFGAMVYAGE